MCSSGRGVVSAVRNRTSATCDRGKAKNHMRSSLRTRTQKHLPIPLSCPPHDEQGRRLQDNAMQQRAHAFAGFGPKFEWTTGSNANTSNQDIRGVAIALFVVRVPLYTSVAIVISVDENRIKGRECAGEQRRDRHLDSCLDAQYGRKVLVHERKGCLPPTFLPGSALNRNLISLHYTGKKAPLLP